MKKTEKTEKTDISERSDKLKKSKKTNTGSIVLLVVLSIVLIGCIAFLYVLVGTKTFFKDDTNKETQIGMVETPEQDNEHTSSESKDNTEEGTKTQTGEGDSLKAEFVYRNLYEGGQLLPSDFEVTLLKQNGSREIITDYTCSMLTDKEYRLGYGANTIVFYYGELSAIVTVEAEKTTGNGEIAPSYLLYGGNKAESEEKVHKLEEGTMTFQDALKDIYFTGDSQIAALVSYHIADADNVDAAIGESADYLEREMRYIIDMAKGKKAIIVHYGINSLSESADERLRRIEQYRELLQLLKDGLPGTRVIVSSVFPVSNSIANNKPSFAYINQYNYSLLAMCMEMNIEYYSNNEYLYEHQECFGGDGLHLTPEFYRNYWVKDLLLTLGL